MSNAPGYTQWLPLPYGAFRRILRDPLGFQLQARERFGDVIRFRNGPILIHFLYHPDHVNHVLYERQKDYLRGWQYRALRKLFGNNLVASEGHYWLRQRRLAQPAFHRQRLAAYADIMADTTTQMLARWNTFAESGQFIDIAPEVSRLTLQIAGKTLFSRDVSPETDAVGMEFAIIARFLERRFNQPFTSLPLWAPTPTNLRFKRARRNLYKIVSEIIRERRMHGGDRGDLLSMLMQARDDETGEQMTDEQLCIEALTFLIAGHETTAAALTWTWYLLGTHSTIRQRLSQDISSVLGQRKPTINDMPALRTIRMAVEESMRLFPPVWAISREARTECEIGGFRVPANSMVILCPFVTHRHPDFWDEPNRFDPNRFTEDQSAQQRKGAYFPFLGGPHQCIGNEFAMLEMCLIIALVLQQFDIELLPGQSIKPKVSLTLRPNNPVMIKLHNNNRKTEGKCRGDSESLPLRHGERHSAKV